MTTRNKHKVDKFFLWLVIFMVFAGFFLFVSAFMGLLAKEDTTFARTLSTQLFGIVLGFIALIITSKIKYQFWKKYSLYLFIGSILLTLLVFVPGVGIEHGGAHRWLKIGSFSIQPAEFLKVGFVIYFAAFLSALKDKLHSPKQGVLQIFLILSIISLILLKQPDTGTLAVIVVSALAMFIVAGGKWRHTFGFVTIGMLGLWFLTIMRPYAKERLLTFLDPTSDMLGAGWQIKQSLIAIGSGKLYGRGFGQSIQKFTNLPEPIGDSIFAVTAEEFGFIGSVVLIAFFVTLAVRGLQIAKRAPDQFGGLLVVGIVILIVGQSFFNIGAMLGVFPLTGIPLLFISQGGSALLATLFLIGIVLNVSKHKKV
ncbi:putative lipid II flippase FtsW [Patescibacteria group bacterium]|nr:putative lipid II flippase FtsW [Patescibacteria group bacterium]MBU1519253.1 putative lipid II flippase FtsW [Patescibacteria group bacterium]MBU2416821.1 putative lipid II flippase FtsW [Patescibacteria group bacterium]MBU2460936.1 putative lipid II flippase FtsW [Patescibacteria group bacterium]